MIFMPHIFSLASARASPNVPVVHGRIDQSRDDQGSYRGGRFIARGDPSEAGRACSSLDVGTMLTAGGSDRSPRGGSFKLPRVARIRYGERIPACSGAVADTGEAARAVADADNKPISVPVAINAARASTSVPRTGPYSLPRLACRQNGVRISPRAGLVADGGSAAGAAHARNESGSVAVEINTAHASTSVHRAGPYNLPTVARFRDGERIPPRAGAVPDTSDAVDARAVIHLDDDVRATSRGIRRSLSPENSNIWTRRTRPSTAIQGALEVTSDFAPHLQSCGMLAVVLGDVYFISTATSVASRVHTPLMTTPGIEI